MRMISPTVFWTIGCLLSAGGVLTSAYGFRYNQGYTKKYFGIDRGWRVAAAKAAMIGLGIFILLWLCGVVGLAHAIRADAVSAMAVAAGSCVLFALSVMALRYTPPARRHLSAAEYRQLGDALRRLGASAMDPSMLAAFKFALVTGWSFPDVGVLRWSAIDEPTKTACLGDTRNRRHMRAVPWTAMAIVQSQPRDAATVFPALADDADGGKVAKAWTTIRTEAGLPKDLSVRDLEYSFVHLAEEAQLHWTMIASMIGHWKTQMPLRRKAIFEDGLVIAAEKAATVARGRLGLKDA